MQGVCHLLTNIGLYCKDALSRSDYELPGLDEAHNDTEALSDYENMELESIVFERVTEEIEARKKASEKVSFHLHALKALSGLVEGTILLEKYFLINRVGFILFIYSKWMKYQ